MTTNLSQKALRHTFPKEKADEYAKRHISTSATAIHESR
jgi:hypothetical protein